MRAELPSAAVTTCAAKQVWASLYHTPWPRGWRCVWRDDFPPEISDALGFCFDERKHIVLNWVLLKADNEPLFNLVHEFMHLRFPRLRHGREFRRILSVTYARLIGDSRPAEMLALRLLGRRFRRGDQRRRVLYARIDELREQIEASHQPTATTPAEARNAAID